MGARSAHMGWLECSHGVLGVLSWDTWVLAGGRPLPSSVAEARACVSSDVSSESDAARTDGSVDARQASARVLGSTREYPGVPGSTRSKRERVLSGSSPARVPGVRSGVLQWKRTEYPA